MCARKLADACTDFMLRRTVFVLRCESAATTMTQAGKCMTQHHTLTVSSTLCPADSNWRPDVWTDSTSESIGVLGVIWYGDEIRTTVQRTERPREFRLFHSFTHSLIVSRSLSTVHERTHEPKQIQTQQQPTNCRLLHHHHTTTTTNDDDPASLFVARAALHYCTTALCAVRHATSPHEQFVRCTARPHWRKQGYECVTGV